MTAPGWLTVSAIVNARINHRQARPRLLDAHGRGASVDQRWLVETALAKLADPHPVGLAAPELPALVGGAHVLAAIARSLAGEVHQRDRRAAELIGDQPAIAVGERRGPDDLEVHGVAIARDADRPCARRQLAAG